MSSGLASQGEPVTLSVKGDLDPTLPACLPGQLDDQERGVTGWVSVSGAVHRSLVVNLVPQAEQRCLLTCPRRVSTDLQSRVETQEVNRPRHGSLKTPCRRLQGHSPSSV